MERERSFRATQGRIFIIKLRFKSLWVLWFTQESVIFALYTLWFWNDLDNFAFTHLYRKSTMFPWYLLWSFFYLSWAIFSLNSSQLCGREQLCRQNRKMWKQTKDKEPIKRWQMRQCGTRQYSQKGQQLVFFAKVPFVPRKLQNCGSIHRKVHNHIGHKKENTLVAILTTTKRAAKSSATESFVLEQRRI